MHFLRRCWTAAGGRPALRHCNRYGAVFELNVYDYIDRIALAEGYYESEVLDALLDRTETGTVFWDVGANFGQHSVTLKRLAPETVVHAFEPSPESGGRLLHHARLNRVDVSLWPLALGDRAGYQMLHVVDEGNPGMTTLLPWPEVTYAARQPVRVERADHLIDGGLVPPPTLLKLDVEGSEFAVLQGLGRHLQSATLRAVVFEAHVDVAAIPLAHPVSALLLANGFAIEPLFRREFGAHSLGNFCAHRP